jgi:hypothetical protein
MPMEKGPIMRAIIQNQEPIEFHMTVAPCTSTTNGDNEFIDDPMKIEVGE